MRPAGGELRPLRGSCSAGEARGLSHLLITVISADDLAAGAAYPPQLCGVGRLRADLQGVNSLSFLKWSPLASSS